MTTDLRQAAAVARLEFEGYEEPCVYDKSGNTMVVTFPTKDTLVAGVEAMGYRADIEDSTDKDCASGACPVR